MTQAVKHLGEYDTETRYKATVVSNERITPEQSDEEVRELVLDVEADFSFQVGQSLGVLAPGSGDFGHEHHFRLYSVADVPEKSASGKPRIQIAVRRCFYIDPYSGEKYKGIASNYLCDLQPGESRPFTFETDAPLPAGQMVSVTMLGKGHAVIANRLNLPAALTAPAQPQGTDR